MLCLGHKGRWSLPVQLLRLPSTKLSENKHSAGQHLCLQVGQKTPGLHVLLSQLDPSGANYGRNAETFFNQYLNLEIPHTVKVSSTCMHEAPVWLAPALLLGS